MGNLQPRETLYLYLFMVAFSFALFAAGVWVGKTYYVDAQAQDTPGLQAPADEGATDEDEPDLDFYENLVGEDKAGEGDSESAQKASDPGEEDSPGESASQPASSPPPSQETASSGSGAQDARREPASTGDPLLQQGYTVQIGAVATQGDADQLIRDLSAKGYQGFIVSPDFSQDSLYRVWVGRYVQRSEALAMEGQLKDAGFATYVKAARFPDDE
ncbi:MAG TPA: SPOR domain-containing protein [Acidobacteriota bacterium]|nr:SPOR domain-containing protein [Acidobacteriota bacterium]